MNSGVNDEGSMIIKCEKCGTKFRFNETLMEEDGAWLKCSRCQNVFFEENPSRQDKRRSGKDDDEFRGNSGFREEDASRYFSASESTDEEDIYEPEIYGGRQSRDTGKRIGKILAYASLSILIILVLSVWTFPEIGGKFYQGLYSAQDYFRSITGGNSSGDQFSVSKMQISDVRQRYINNLIVGKIRIVEGTVLNESKFFVSNSKVRGDMLDRYGTSIAQREVYCGNLLTDEELMIKTEDEMMRQLSNPLGSDASNEKIAPGGQIPFMLIFIHEPPGAVKTTVTLIGAERLLP